MNEILRLAMEQARKTMNENIGGPFGAAVIAANGEILAVTSNSVLRDNDPTAHAEVNAIRAACKKIGSYDLSGCVLYTTETPPKRPTNPTRFLRRAHPRSNTPF